MADELAWRKFPRSTISSPELDYISSMQPDGMRTAPYMFFMAMYCRCDDQGVFDLGNGILFSRMMKAGSPELAMSIAEAMCGCGIISRVIEGENVFIINDWDAPDRKGFAPARTAEQRRLDVRKKMLEARRESAQAESQQAPQFAPAQPQTVADFDAARRAVASAPQPDFFAPSMTKNEKVSSSGVLSTNSEKMSSKTVFDDKNAENVGRQRERERERQTDTQNIQSIQKTHTEADDTDRTDRETEETGERDADRLRGQLESPLRQSGGEETAEQTTQETQTPENTQTDTSSLAEAALQGRQPTERETAEAKKSEEKAAFRKALPGMRRVAESFFAKNCLGFDTLKNMAAVENLCWRVFKLGSSANPPETVLKAVLQQFKAMSENGDSAYFKGTPLFPEYLLKQNIWLHVLQRVSKIFSESRTSEAWKAQMLPLSEEEMAEVDVVIEAQCVEYGIDPDDPQRMTKIMRARFGGEQTIDTG